VLWKQLRLGNLKIKDHKGLLGVQSYDNWQLVITAERFWQALLPSCWVGTAFVAKSHEGKQMFVGCFCCNTSGKD
jgi:hypothetical protein